MKRAKSIAIICALCLAGLLLALRASVAPAEGQDMQGSFTVVDTIAPAAVTDLGVIGETTTSLTLTWTAPGDDGDWGTAAQYDIRYSNSLIATEAEWDAATQVAGEPAPKPAGSTETFVVTGLSPATTYCFALKTANGVPTWSGLSNSACGTTLGGGGGGGGGIWGGGVPPEPGLLELQVDMWGTVTSGSMTEEGTMIETIRAPSADGVLTVLLSQGTTVLDCEGNPPYQIEVKPVIPPDSPPDAYVIGLGYDLEPCCIFDPPIAVIIHYDPEALSDSVDQQDLVIAYYDRERQEWVVLPSVVDTGAQTVTASVSHSSMFAMLAPVPEVTPTPTPSPAGGLGTGAWIGIGMGILGLVGLTVGLIIRRRGVT
ncbi:hypothetical protein ES703_100468 [subsurface metagenome]